MIGQFCLQFSVKYLSDREKRSSWERFTSALTNEQRQMNYEKSKLQQVRWNMIKKNAELFHRIVKAVKKFGMVINSQKVYEFYIRTYSARILVPTNQPTKQAWVTISDFLHRTAVVRVGCKSKATNGKAFVNVIFVCETVRKIVWWGSCSTIEFLKLMELQDIHIRYRLLIVWLGYAK